MKPLTILKKFINGSVVLETVNSKYNGQITVDEDLLGKRKLLVGGITQSGPAVEKIWKRTINGLTDYRITNCLILGLGAGNAAVITNKYFPEAKITGIEIDPKIITLGERYFSLRKISNLKIEIGNAFTWVNNCSNDLNHDNNKFDLILVDLYFGDCFPKKAGDEKFLAAVKKILTSRGLVIFNRLYYKENIQKTDNFQKKLSIIFSKIEAKKIDYNKLFLCRK